MATQAPTASRPAPTAARTAEPASGARARGKRAAIIAAAKLVFFQEGYAGASMDRITAEAGVSKATVYNHFRSKEELLLAVVDDVIVPFHTDYRAVLDHEAPFLEWLTALAIAVARKATTPETIALTRLMMAESRRFPELGRIFVHAAVESTLDLYQPKFEQAVATGILRTGNVRAMIERFLEACATRPQRAFLYSAPNPMTPAEIEAHARETVQYFLHGYSVAD